MEHKINEWRGVIADYLLACKARNLSSSSLEGKAYHLRQISNWADCAPQEFTRAKMRQYMAFRKDSGVAEKTLRSDVLEIRLFFRFLREEGYIEINHLADYKLPKAAKPHVYMPSAADLAKLLSAVRRRWDTRHHPGIKAVAPKRRKYYAARDAAILALLIDTGARVGEILALRMDDIKIGERKQGGEIVIRQSKGDMPRVVPISPSIAPYIDSFIAIRKLADCDSDLFAVTCWGTRVKPDDFGCSFRDYMKFAGLSGFTLHGIRHYAITQLAKQDVLAASAIAGHKSLIVTRGYIHTDADHVRQQHSLADPLGKVLRGISDDAPAALPRRRAF